VGLGDDAKELEKLARGWEKTAESAKPSHAGRVATAGKLQHEVAPLVAQLSKESDARRAELARWIVELDSGASAAEEALGRKQDPDGAWLDAEQQGWRSGAKRVAESLRAVRAIAPKIERDKSDNAALAAVCGGGNVVRGHGIELHSAAPPESL